VQLGGAVQNFRNLQVWERAHELVLEVYGATNLVQAKKYPGLVAQLRRSAASIPANIAEGCGHGTQREFARFLQMALASAHETHYHLQLAHDLGMMPGPAFAKLDARTEQVKQMLSGLLRKVRAKTKEGTLPAPSS
jgi:four helix bundle protein